MKKRGSRRKAVKPLPNDAPIDEDRVRFVAISDTHDKLGQLAHTLPPGDVLIHAGDFTSALTFIPFIAR